MDDPDRDICVGVFAVISMCLALILSGCAPPTKLIQQPTIIARSESAISIKAGAWTNARPRAAAHCAQFGREAVFVSEGPLSHDKVLRLYVFECRAHEGR